ncbi:MAG: HNH endonuclease [Phycisphaera sp. RhM]|nr:HNH endonuclease [Phycisphaera sp. RhM]
MLRQCAADSREETSAKEGESPTAISAIAESYGLLGHSNSDGADCDTKNLPVATFENPMGLRVADEAAVLEASTTRVEDYQSMRPCDVVRALNRCGLGRVIHDRQLYRHRQEAESIESSKKRINLMAYAAWLFDRRHRKQKRKRQRKIDNHVVTIDYLRKKLDEQAYCCAISGEHLTPDNFALDHIIALADGGDFSPSNCQLVTKAVNRAKNTMSQEDFIAMCQRITRFQESKTP